MGAAFLWLALAGCAGGTGGTSDPGASSNPGGRVDVPADLEPAWMAGRAEAQTKGEASIGAFHGFRFDDRVADSGITFIGRAVDDAGKTFKSVHYDHGTGLAIADVDGDGLLDAYFVRQVGPNALWRNLGGGRFEDITQHAGVAAPDRIGVSASFADIDNDGDADLYTTSVRRGNVLYENDGTGVFTDISKAAGVDHEGHSSGTLFFDYDRDGRLDLFLTNIGQYTSDTVRTASAAIPGLTLSAGERAFNEGFTDGFAGHLKPERTERSLLYRNVGGAGGNRFEDVTDAVGIVAEGWSGDASVIDGNDDGWPDLYVLNMQGDDDYFENDHGTRFVSRGREVFPKTPWGSMGIEVLDYDNDGRLDIYVTDMHSDMSALVDPFSEKLKADMQWPESTLRTNGRSLFGNALYHNDGGGRYTEMSEVVGAETFWPWGLSVGDLNADGFEDAFVTAGMGYPFRYGINSLLLNDRGTRLADAEFILGVEPRRDGAYANPSFALDCSGADSAHADCKGHTGPIEVWGALSSRASAVFDLDDDGDLDILTNEMNAAPMVLLSTLASAKPDAHFLKVRLRGTASNRDGLGAVVTVTAGGQRLTQPYDGKSGYLSQSRMPLYFGLGDSAAAERVEVVWPGGGRQVVDGPIAANALLDIEETTTPGAP